MGFTGTVVDERVAMRTEGLEPVRVADRVRPAQEDRGLSTGATIVVVSLLVSSQLAWLALLAWQVVIRVAS